MTSPRKVTRLLPRIFELVASLVGSIVLACHPCSASGFLNDIQSANSASVSTAGQTAIAEDAGTVYYNPAGMTLLDHAQLVAAAGIIFPSGTFTNGGSSDILGNPMGGSTTVKNQVFPLPSLFATAPISDRLHVGLGLFVPFGQIFKYDEDWVGRYQVQRISLKTIEIDPTIAYRVSKVFSVGGGIDVQYAHLSRANAIDFGSLCFVVIGPGPCPGLGLLPQGADGRLVADVDGWAVGYNLSALYHPSDATHVGFNYRSAVSHPMSGSASFDVPVAAAPLSAVGLPFQNTGAHSSLAFPAVVALGLSQKIDERLTMLFDVDWTLWSRVKGLSLTFSNPQQPSINQPLNWHDTVKIAIGGIYRVTDDVDLRAGLSYDQSPIPDQYRTADLPDSDRMMVSVGVAYRIGHCISTTVSYSYGHYAAAGMNLTTSTGGTVTGTFHRSSNAIGLQAGVYF